MEEKLIIAEQQGCKKNELYLKDSMRLAGFMIRDGAYKQAHVQARRSLRGFKKLGISGNSGYEEGLRIMIKHCGFASDFRERDAYSALLATHKSRFHTSTSGSIPLPLTSSETESLAAKPSTERSVQAATENTRLKQGKSTCVGNDETSEALSTEAHSLYLTALTASHEKSRPGSREVSVVCSPSPVTLGDVPLITMSVDSDEHTARPDSGNSRTLLSNISVSTPHIRRSASNPELSSDSSSGQRRAGKLPSRLGAATTEKAHQRAVASLSSFPSDFPKQTYAPGNTYLSNPAHTSLDCDGNTSELSPSLRSEHSAAAYIPGISTSSTEGPLAAASCPKEALKSEPGRIRRALSRGRMKFMSSSGRLTEDKE